MSKKVDISPELAKAVKDLLATKEMTFDQKKAAIDTAMRFEALKLKAKGPAYGKGFEDDEGGDADGESF
jgi:hypothetical protein